MIICDRHHKVSPNPNPKIVTILQCMKNGTLCDVYCEVPWISLCHSIGHVCYLFTLQIWPFSTCVTNCFCFTSPSTRNCSFFNKLKPFYLSEGIGKTRPLPIRVLTLPTVIKELKTHKSKLLSPSHPRNTLQTSPVIFISITWPWVTNSASYFS